jgi:CO/xanthine dehydrogenase FAD-binding subunit
VKPAPLRYERAETIGHAVALLGEHGDEAKVLAGGQSLVPALNMRLLRPAVLVDIERVRELDNVDEVDGTLRVGAMRRQADPRLLRHPLLAEAIPHVGHFVTRNRGPCAAPSPTQTRPVSCPSASRCSAAPCVPRPFVGSA